jgi:1-acyl-sn-glycerol-3-phosphate acyltransferase
MLRRELISYTIVRALIRAAILLLTRMRVHGHDHLPASGAAIVVSNHIAAIDPGILVGALPRPIALMSKIENYRGPLKLFMPMVGAFTVRRGAADRRALATAEQVLQRGQLLAMFPEGTRSRTGALGTAQGGAALLALKTGVPIVPVALAGTQRVFQRRFPWLGYPRVTVTIGAPFSVEPLDRPARREDRDRVTTLMMAHIAALLSRQESKRSL